MGGLESNHYVRTIIRKNRAIYYVAVLVAAVLSARCGGGNGSSGQTEPKATASVSPTLAPATPSPTAEPPTPDPTPGATALPTQPPPTAPPATEAAAPTADTRVPMGLPRADQIQLGKDGKYFVADRGDGCTWVERVRRQSETVGLVISLFTDCPADFFFSFRPESGEVFLTQE